MFYVLFYTNKFDKDRLIIVLKEDFFMRVSQVTVRKRLFIALCVGVILFSVLLFRLAYIQLIKGNWLTGLADEQWSKEIPYEGKRGKILDRNGKILAYNITAPTIMAIPVQIEDKVKTAKALAEVLEMREEKVFQLISKRELKVYIAPQGRKVTEELAKKVYDLNLPGIVVTEDSKRFYPNGSFLSHVLGFAGIDNQGLTGIELIHNEMLSGKQGNVSFLSDNQGREMPGQKYSYLPPEDGKDLVLTIDKMIQSFVEREMNQAMTKFQADGAMAIVMNPKTGEILGMASYPTFDPGNFQDYPSEIYNRNQAIWRSFEPGSTFKIITLAAALEEKKVKLTDSYYDPGFISVAGQRLRCWKRLGHGSETFLEVVQNSCNPGFVTLGQRLGKDTLLSYLKDFGFTEKTGIDMQGEGNSIMFRPEKLGPVELATTAFGQGVSVTPIQQVAAVAAAINGGYLVTPYVAKEWHNPVTGEVISVTNPKIKRQVISEETSRQVRDALESVVAKGTGGKAYIDGYRVGGKTGTAQKPAPGGGYLVNNHIVSFMGFAPADDPEIVVYVAIDNPKGIQFGGVVAAPIAKNILQDSLVHLDVEPRKDGLIKSKYIYPERPPVEVPMLIGMTINEVRLTEYSFPLEWEGSGDFVVNQTPQAGASVDQGATIRIYLGDKQQSGD